MASDPGPSEASPSSTSLGHKTCYTPSSPIHRDGRLTLSEIYRSLPSPSVPPGLECPQPDDIHTPLFAYQLRSLSLMLLREQPARQGTDPRFLQADGIRIHSDNQKPVESQATIECQAINGGILSEEMGAGKTLITLACILSTRGSLPHHDPSKLHSQHSISFKGVGAPSKRHSQADQERSTRRLAPLTALSAHVLGANGYSNADDPSGILPSPLRDLIDDSKPYYLLTAPSPARKPRVALPELSMKVYLSPATLVVVPRTLLTQWRDEIRKHVRPEAKLRFLVLDDGCGDIPSPKELCTDWDIILLTHSRFGAEESGGALQVRWPSVPRKCQCPYIGASRTVDCRCPPPPKLEPQASPLLQCKFRRLVIDEGNVVAGSSGLVKLAARLACQSRWIVSGTPTELMTGAAGEVLTTGLEDGEAEGASQSESQASEVPIEARPLAPLTDAEASDLRRLKALLVDFLRLPPFWSSPEEEAPPHPVLDWNTMVIAPLRAQALGARTRLKSIMSDTMIRNQPADLLSLPALHRRTIKLPFTRRERLTHNALLCLVSINAELSEREGKQWFFHHVNKKFLHEIMMNLALACFHFGSDTLAKSVADALGRAKEGGEKLEKKGKAVPRALHEAIAALEEAVADEAWRWGQSEYVRFSTNLDGQLRNAFDSSSPSQWRDADGKPLLKADELCALQMCADKVLKKARRGGPGGGEGREEWGAEEVLEEVVTAGERWKRGAVVRAEKRGETGASSGRSREATKRSSEATASGSSSSAADPASTAPTLDPDLIPSELAGAVLLGASSTKVAHILDLILSMPKGDKAIIFSEMSGVLYELAGALRACSIGASYHASGQAQARRDEAIARFKSDAEVRVLLMGARVGGRGIDLSCANHVIFVSPINDAALKLQALKRAYRTGQTKETHVTTFVMLDSFEDHLASSGPRRANGSSAAAASNRKRQRNGAAEQGSEGDEARLLAASNPNGDDEEMRMRRVLLYPRHAKAHRSEGDSDVKRNAGIVRIAKPAPIFSALRHAKGIEEKEKVESNHEGEETEADELEPIRTPPPPVEPLAPLEPVAKREGSSAVQLQRSRSPEWVSRTLSVPPANLSVPAPATPRVPRSPHPHNGIDSHMAPRFKPGPTPQATHDCKPPPQALLLGSPSEGDASSSSDESELADALPSIKEESGEVRCDDEGMGQDDIHGALEEQPTEQRATAPSGGRGEEVTDAKEYGAAAFYPELSPESWLQSMSRPARIKWDVETQTEEPPGERSAGIEEQTARHGEQGKDSQAYPLQKGVKRSAETAASPEMEQPSNKKKKKSVAFAI